MFRFSLLIIIVIASLGCAERSDPCATKLKDSAWSFTMSPDHTILLGLSVDDTGHPIGNLIYTAPFDIKMAVVTGALDGCTATLSTLPGSSLTGTIKLTFIADVLVGYASLGVYYGPVVFRRL